MHRRTADLAAAVSFPSCHSAYVLISAIDQYNEVVGPNPNWLSNEYSAFTTLSSWIATENEQVASATVVHPPMIGNIPLMSYLRPLTSNQ